MVIRVVVCCISCRRVFFVVVGIAGISVGCCCMWSVLVFAGFAVVVVVVDVSCRCVSLSSSSSSSCYCCCKL